MKTPGARTVFVASAAVIAAALVDPIVEKLSNAGAFGVGSFTDGSNADVLPALGIGALLCALFVGLSVQRMLRETPVTRFLCRSVSRLDLPSALALVPAIYPLQLGVLYAMETLEQRFVVGHMYGGTTWLGGPLWASLLLHLLGSFIVTLILASALQAATKHVADAVRSVAQTFAQMDFGRSTPRYQPVAVAWRLEPRCSRLHGRAPPRASL
jgi:hypothetical protein